MKGKDIVLVFLVLMAYCLVISDGEYFPYANIGGAMILLCITLRRKI